MKILVAYATRAGSTAEIAGVIGKALEDAAMEADVRNIAEIVDLGSCDAAVIGSPLYMGKVLREVAPFIQQHSQELAEIPLAAFVVGTSMVGREEKFREQARTIMAGAMLPIRPREIGVFAGALDPDRISVGEKAVIKLVKAPYGDFRDWDAIRAWAGHLPAILRD
ncbi:MAG: flavodoxin domain-containing protein [Methanomicrobiales archaeon]|nr:flavodoxin domain-containing protein [Methanomicrobiales archaeon]